ncbi:MFS transporter [Parasphingorhabdus cellanae]|uniref:MFS transporter n=1 Tax=Parasphingorhabdus cellanae TaxID=2806553 RepID=A0ABX7T7U6_9SPHN|nr:MFS transporter [Parasphingorhabdus cellanae]QTD56930.1 MFS transporter [Parasphingorhabdus cellanae]
MPGIKAEENEDAVSGQVVQRKFYGWHNAALLFAIQFAASGFVYFAYAAIFPAMVEAMDWNRGSASIAHSLSFLTLGLSYPLTAWMIGKWGVRLTLTSGLVMMLASLLLTIFFVTQIWHWTLAWGIVMGMAMALAGPLCGQTVVIQWFNVKRATVLGIIMTGNALGGFVAQPVLIRVMEEYDTWQSGWYVSGIAVIIALLLTQFIINRPADIGQHSDNIDPAAPQADARKAAPKPRTYRSEHSWTIRQVFRTRAVYFIMTVNITYLAIGTFLLTHGSLYLSDTGISKIQTASVVSLFIMASGLGRMPAGWLGDRFELRWLMAAMMAAMLFGFLLLWAAADFVGLSVAAFILGLCYGGFFALSPALTSNFFGQESFAKINSVFAPLLLPFVAMAPAGAGYIFDIYGSYDLAFLIGSVLLSLSLISAICLTPPHPETAKAA